MKNWKPEFNKWCTILVGKYKGHKGLIVEKTSKHIPGKGNIFIVEHLLGSTFVTHSYIQDELGPNKTAKTARINKKLFIKKDPIPEDNSPIESINEKAPTAVVDAECLAGLIRAAELLEIKEAGIWDHKAREALAFVRKGGLCASKPLTYISENVEQRWSKRWNRFQLSLRFR